MDIKKYQWYCAMFDLEFMSSKGNTFQNFFNSIMRARYPADFMPARPWGDEGDRKCDGYLRSQRQLFQVYAPDGPLSKSQTLQKMEEDFNGALPYWQQHFNTWTFVHNTHPQSGLPPFVIERLLAFEQNNPSLNCNQWGCTELRNHLLDLPENRIVTVLRDAPSDESMSKLTMEGIKDVLDDIQLQPGSIACDLSVASSQKLNYNNLSPYVHDLFQTGLRKSGLVKSYFDGRTWDPEYGDRVAKAFTIRYLELKNEGYKPDTIYWHLQIFTGGDRLASPERASAVIAVLSYLFESCDIFERVPIT